MTDILHAVFFKDASTGWVVGDNGDVLTTTNGGATWTLEPDGPLGYSLLGVHSVESTYIVGAAGLYLKRTPCSYSIAPTSVTVGPAAAAPEAWT